MQGARLLLHSMDYVLDFHVATHTVLHGSSFELASAVRALLSYLPNQVVCACVGPAAPLRHRSSFS